jgi:hypothetical protein
MSTQHGTLRTIWSSTACCRITLYADNTGIFANPLEEELQAISAIMDYFGKASGLLMNLSKTGFSDSMLEP